MFAAVDVSFMVFEKSYFHFNSYTVNELTNYFILVKQFSGRLFNTPPTDGRHRGS